MKKRDKNKQAKLEKAATKRAEYTKARKQKQAAKARASALLK
jgi:hypothetical protein